MLASFPATWIVAWGIFEMVEERERLFKLAQFMSDRWPGDKAGAAAAQRQRRRQHEARKH